MLSSEPNLNAGVLFPNAVFSCSGSGIPVCRGPNVKCEVHCCSSDYCNEASRPLVGGLFVAVTASFMYWFCF